MLWCLDNTTCRYGRCNNTPPGSHRHGIRINTVAPAVVRTPVYEAFVPKEDIDSALDAFNSFHPLGRVGTPDDIAPAVRPAPRRRARRDSRRPRGTTSPAERATLTRSGRTASCRRRHPYAP
ncbi:SDR family oxidoreductase [Streptomyces sp. GMR22]|uniref:SDR family oxidoreductase n=1 Tax=Streptomyces sp. GMR22 TaxID=2759524 RepID=UPI0015FBC452|nr:SDR family oxidoreductase [Streptomyces sp. GMR22]MBA6441589.1 SDR family oxidoreductase [Streptomyces sp. GMR22]